MTNCPKKIMLLRLMQVGVALIPFVIGVLALVNDLTSFKGTVSSVVLPLITMQGNTTEAWRALPGSWANLTYVGMFCAEFLTGILAGIGIIQMLKSLCKDAALFENAKIWVYIACGWGLMVWGLGFFEGGGDWFLSWQNNNLAGFQQGGLNYALEMLMTFVYLKLNQES